VNDVERIKDMLSKQVWGEFSYLTHCFVKKKEMKPEKKIEALNKR